MSDKREEDAHPHSEDILNIAGIETREESAVIRQLANKAVLVRPLSWEEMLGLKAVKGL